jgi:hypothetical protein
MRRFFICAIGVLALALAFDAAAFAQQDEKAKKRGPKQTQDRGDAAELEALPDRNVDAPVIVHGDGALSSILDESFLEAMVVVKNADGSLSYRCVHGLTNAAHHAKSHGKRGARPKAAVTKTLEVK